MPAEPRKIKDLFLAALNDPDRTAFLERECAGEPELRARLDQLLFAHDSAPTADAIPVASDETANYPGKDEHVGAILGGKYKLIEAIGEGGMGTVYMAQQTEPVKRAVAVKVVKAGMDSKAVLARFEAERQALAMMDHPNIARVLDAGTTESGRPFFVMELVKGQPITQYCDERKLMPKARLELFVQVCNAIQHAHQKGVIHRDIKPSNVLIAMYDDRPVPKVIDFGVAKATGQCLTDQTLMTGFGAVVGTPEYMSPEQANLNNLDVDTRSDVYSLGVLLYELLTGTTPVDRKSLGKAAILEILRIVREVEAPRPSSKLSTSDTLPSVAANRGIEPAKLSKLMRGELDWLVLKALEKDRTRRYETANGFAADIQRYLSGEAVLAHPPSAGYRLKKFFNRHKGPVIAAGLVMAALVIGFGGTGLGFVEARKQRDTASANEERANLNAEIARTAEEEAKGERDKNRNALSDSYGSTGLNAVDPAESLVWFAKAAEVAGPGTERERINRERLGWWEATTPAPVRVLQHEGQSLIQKMHFHPGGHYLLTKNSPEPDWTGHWTLWDLSREKRLDWPGDVSGVSSAAWDKTGELLALGTKSGELILARFPSGEVLYRENDKLPIHALAFDPNGELLAFARGGLAIDYLDIPSRTRRSERALFPGSRDRSTPRPGTARYESEVAYLPFDLQFNPNGSNVLVRSINRISALWEIPRSNLSQISVLTYLPIDRPKPQDVFNRPPTAPAWVEEGRSILTLLTSEVDYIGRGVRQQPQPSVIDLALTKPIRSLQVPGGFAGTILNSGASPDGRTAFLGSSLESYLFDLRTGKPIRDKFDWGNTRNWFTYAHSFSPDSSLIYTAWSDNAVRRHFTATGASAGTPILFPQRVENVAASPDGIHIATAEPGGLVRVWRMNSKRASDFDMVLDGRSSLTRFTPDGRYVFPTGLSHRSSTVASTRVYDVETQKPIGPAVTMEQILDADATRDAKLLAVIGQIAVPRPTTIYDASGNAIPLSARSINDRSLQFTYPGQLRVLDPRTGRDCAEPISLGLNLRSVRFHPKGHQVAVLAAVGRIFVYDAETLGLIKTWTAQAAQNETNHFINNGAIKYSPDGKYLVAFGTNDCTANLYDSQTGKLILALKHPKESEYQKIHDVHFSMDSAVAFTTCWSDKAVRSWKIPSGVPAGPALIHPDWPFMADLAVDGTSLITACRDRTARIWNWQTGKEILAPLRHTDEVHGVAFTPDGKRMVTTSDDQTVRIWDAKSGKAISPPIPTGSRALVPAMASDGRFVAIGGQMETLPVIDLRPSANALTLSDAEVVSGLRFAEGGVARMAVPEWQDRWKQSNRKATATIDPTHLAERNWPRLAEAEARGDWGAVIAISSELLKDHSGDLGLWSRRIRALAESGDFKTALADSAKVPDSSASGTGDQLPNDEFYLARSRGLLALKTNDWSTYDAAMDRLVSAFSSESDPRIYSLIPWSYSLADPLWDGKDSWSVNNVYARGVLQQAKKNDATLIDLTRRARGSDVNERFYYRVAALMNIRLAFTNKTVESSRGTLRASLDRLDDIERLTNVFVEEMDWAIRAITEHHLGLPAEAKEHLDLAECLWKAKSHRNFTENGPDWIQRTETELLLAEARRTLAMKPWFPPPKGMAK